MSKYDGLDLDEMRVLAADLERKMESAVCGKNYIALGELMKKIGLLGEAILAEASQRQRNAVKTATEADTPSSGFGTIDHVSATGMFAPWLGPKKMPGE